MAIFEQNRKWKDDYITHLSRVPVHPIPDITQYNPDDYTDIKKHQLSLSRNKGK